MRLPPPAPNPRKARGAARGRAPTEAPRGLCTLFLRGLCTLSPVLRLSPHCSELTKRLSSKNAAVAAPKKKDGRPV